MPRKKPANTPDGNPEPAAPMHGVRRFACAIVVSASVLLIAATVIPAPAHAESGGGATANYVGAAFSAPLDWHYVSALDPAYSETVYSVSPGAVLRHYPPDAIGVAVELSYLHPWARVVHADRTSATTGRGDHTSWAGVRSSVAATNRWVFDAPASEDFLLFSHLDGGVQLAYYYRAAENIFGERSFQSSRLGLAVTARPGLVFEVRDSFFFGVDVLFGASLVNRESVDRRYLEDIVYNSFLRGVFVAPGVSAGVLY